MHILATILDTIQSLALVYFTILFNRPLTIFVHEAGHAFAGWSVGLKLKSFEITRTGGQCVFHEDARAHQLADKPAHIAWIAASGSLANAIAAVLLLGMALQLRTSSILPGWSVLGTCLGVIGLTNAVIASFLFFHRKDSESDGYRVGRAWQMWRTKKDPPTAPTVG